MSSTTGQRFLTIEQVAQELATSNAQIAALVRRGELEALQLGGRGQWRIERSKLEAFIASAYEHTARQLRQRASSANDVATVEDDEVEEEQDDDQDDE